MIEIEEEAIERFRGDNSDVSASDTYKSESAEGEEASDEGLVGRSNRPISSGGRVRSKERKTVGIGKAEIGRSKGGRRNSKHGLGMAEFMEYEKSGEWASIL